MLTLGQIQAQSDSCQLPPVWTCITLGILTYPPALDWPPCVWPSLSRRVKIKNLTKLKQLSFGFSVIQQEHSNSSEHL